MGNDGIGFYRELVDASQDVLFETDGRGVFTYLNPAWEAVTGRPVADAIGCSLFDFIHPEDREAARRDLRPLLEGTEELWQHEVRYLAKSGDSRWIRGRVRLVRGSDGRLERTRGTLVDVTERRLAEDALREARQSLERRVTDRTYDLLKANEVLRAEIAGRRAAEEGLALLAQMVQSSKELISITDTADRFTFVNRAFLDAYGYEESELLGQPVSLLKSARYTARALADLHAETVGGSFIAELWNRRKDGREFPIALATSIVRDRTGQVLGFLGIANDISERLRAEQALRASEEQYRVLFESNPQPMWVYDLETLRFLAVNRTAVEQYGFSREQFLTLHLSDIRPPEDVPLMNEVVREPHAGQHLCGSFRHRRADGTLLDVEITSHAIAFDGRQARLVMAIDVTERRRAEEAVRRSEERFRFLIENAPVVVIVLDGEAQVRYASPSASTVLGYAPEEVVSRPIFELLHPEDAPPLIEALAAAVQSAASGDSVELRFRHHDGSWRVLDVAIKGVRDVEGAPGVVLNAWDATARQALESQLRQAQKMEAVGRLAGGVAHDFNNLLTAIIGYSELLLELGLLQEEDRQRVLEIRKAGERAATLTSQLLAFSRKQVQRPEVLEPAAIVRGLEGMLRRLIAEHIELEIRIDPAAGRAKADPNQLEQVLLNLVVNARDAMPGGGRLLIEVRPATLDEAFARQHPGSRPGSYVCLGVADNGVGMDADTRSHLFEPFFTTKEKGRGTGLGLSTVYGIVKQSGGYIGVDSQPGRGATFEVYLPRVLQGATGTQPMVSGQRPTGGGHETILIVEDEPAVRTLARQVLEEQGYRVLVASSGAEALELSSAGEIHLLLTDVVMPGMTGPKLARTLQGQRPGLRVLFMSGYTADADGFPRDLRLLLSKPFTPASLVSRVREVLDSPPESKSGAHRKVRV